MPFSLYSVIKYSKQQGRRRPKAGWNETARGQAEADAAFVRSVLIDRLDGLAADRVMPVAKREFGLDGDRWIRLLQFLQVQFFPEEFAEAEPAGYAQAGLVPRGGRLARVGERRFRALVEQLRAAREKVGEGEGL